MKKSFSKLIVGTLLTGVVMTSGVSLTNAQSLDSHSSVQQEQTTKYPTKVMEAVRVSLGADKHSTELDSQIETMPKVQVMDKYLESFGKKLKGKEIRKVVEGVFNIDLDTISKNNYGSKLNSYDSVIMETLRDSLGATDAEIMNMPKAEVMDAYIKAHDYALSGDENRVLINQIFGVNLNGISGLEHAQLGINSKGAWIIQSPTDLFVISSSLDDVSIYVNTTDFYKEVTGTNEFPVSLKEKLMNAGFTYDAVSDKYSWTNATGESAPDAFKGQTIGAILQAIQEVNANL